MRRDEQSDTHCGMLVSEKAQVKNLEATVVFCDADSGLDGLRTQVPYYNTQDVLVDGVEYAVARADGLSVKIEGTDYLPINKYVKVRKCENEHVLDERGDVALYMTDKHIETTNWCEVLDVATDCEKMRREYIGMFCHLPEDNERLARVGYSKDFMAHEDLIEFLVPAEG